MRDVTISVAAAAVLSIAVAAGFLATSDACRHWMVVPIVLCGVLCGIDAVDWIRGKVDTFDPVGLLGLVGLYVFVLAPLLTVASGHRLMYIDRQPDDYRHWIGGMACLHVIGLSVYQWTRRWMAARPQPSSNGAHWALDPARVRVVLPVLLVLTAIAQALVFARFGGVAGYAAAFKTNTLTSDAFKGTGWMLMFSESFPILFTMAVGLWLGRHRVGRYLLTAALLLAVVLVLQVFFGGLRGSRAAMIWGLFWAAGIVHVTMRPFSRRLLLAGLPLVIVVAFVWGWYKDVGVGAARVFTGDQAAAAGVTRDWQVLLLSDLSRSDVQALALWRLMDDTRSWTPAMGRTYAGAVALLIPERVWPGRPPAKIRWTTDLEFDEGSYRAGRRTSRVYGLSGEALLNVGPIGVPVAFACLGLLVGLVQRWRTRWDQQADARRLLAPFLVSLCLLALVYDSDNLVFSLVKNGTVPFLVVAVCSVRTRSRPAEKPA